MKILDMLPQLDRAALATMHANATRLTQTGTPKQRQQATDALPLIEAEQAKRADEEPAKPVRKIAPKPAQKKPKAAKSA